MILDRLIIEFDHALRTLAAPARSVRNVPGAEQPEAELSDTDKRHIAALMRINHVGEICAQALYQGQALTSRDDTLRHSLRYAAREETEHLAWTAGRLEELGARTSVLNPLWYAGSLALGVAAGIAGDKWNLGFLAETERQVESHLKEHLEQIPVDDQRSRAILDQMKIDEIGHAETAVRLGAAELPAPVKGAMRLMAQVMKRTAYYI